VHLEKSNKCGIRHTNKAVLFIRSSIPEADWLNVGVLAAVVGLSQPLPITRIKSNFH